VTEFLAIMVRKWWVWPTAGAVTGFFLDATPGLMAGAGGGLLLAVVLQLTHMFAFRNFHPVVPGQAYRCAQPSRIRLAQLLHRYRIGTVVNLRGVNVQPWYHREREVTDQFRVAQVDIGLAARRLPFLPDLLALVRVFDNGPRPLLFHCSLGADRTGLVSALFLLLGTEGGLAEARRQLGLCYGCLSLGRFRAAGEFLNQYEGWLRTHRLSHAPGTCRHWLRHAYCPGLYWYRSELLEAPDRVLPGQPAGVRVRFHNTSLRSWRFRADPHRGIHVGLLLRDSEGGLVQQGRLGLFDATIGPGASIEETLHLPALPEGDYQLMVDLVRENDCWFHQSGCRPLLVDLRVR
jgi:hypothetical protein